MTTEIRAFLRDRRITADLLIAEGACSDQIDLFRETFPNGCKVTLANCRKAATAGLNLHWAAEHLLPETAWATYRAAIAPAWATYEAATAPAFYEAWKLNHEEQNHDA